MIGGVILTCVLDVRRSEISDETHSQKSLMPEPEPMTRLKTAPTNPITTKIQILPIHHVASLETLDLLGAERLDTALAIRRSSGPLHGPVSLRYELRRSS